MLSPWIVPAQERPQLLLHTGYQL
ncbi:hypothetical protein NC651_039254 [Populus alba x Populus x berolinensis]|nr:hypothetical protein NC651_039254 [Populus alba x Populus x berolinensis]